MTHKDFIQDVQKLCHLDHQQSMVLLNALGKLMAQAGVEQVPVTLSGLGTFTSHKHPEYIQEDPHTGAQTLYPPRITYRMQASDPDATSDIVCRQLSEHTRVELAITERFVQSMVRVITDGLRRDEEVEVKGIGTFRNIFTHQGELQRVAYTPDDQMRTQVNAPFNCFEPVVISNAPAEVVASVLPAEPSQETPEPVVVEPSIAIEPPIVDEQPIVDEPPIPIESPVVVEPPISVESPITEEPTVIAGQTSAEDVAIPVVAAADTNPTSNITNTNNDTDNMRNEDFNENEEETTEPKYSVGHNRPVSHLVSWMCGLLVIACIAMVWFVLSLDKEDLSDTDYSVTTSSVVYDDEELSDIIAADQIDDSLNQVAAAEVAEEEASPAALPVETAPQTETVASNMPEAQPKTNDKPEANPKTENQPEAKPEAKTGGNAGTSAIQGRKRNPDGSYATYKLQSGDRLTLVALKYYGDKCFWPYIFEVNRDKLKEPGLVQSGMVLYLPDAEYFGIDANNAESVRKAKNAASSLVK